MEYSQPAASSTSCSDPCYSDQLMQITHDRPYTASCKHATIAHAIVKSHLPGRSRHHELTAVLSLCNAQKNDCRSQPQNMRSALPLRQQKFAKTLIYYIAIDVLFCTTRSQFRTLFSAVLMSSKFNLCLLSYVIKLNFGWLKNADLSHSVDTLTHYAGNCAVICGGCSRHADCACMTYIV